MAGCSARRTTHPEPGDVRQQHLGRNTLPVDIESTKDSQVVGQMKQLKDTLRAEVPELAKMIENTASSLISKMVCLKPSRNLPTQKLDEITKVDGQIRDLLEHEDFRSDYAESDHYI